MILGVKNLNTKKPVAPVITDEDIADRLNAVDRIFDLMDMYEMNVHNLYELKRLAKAGKSQTVTDVLGYAASEEQLDAMIEASYEDFLSTAATVAMVGLDLNTLGKAATFKQFIETIMETTKFITKKFRKNVERLKGHNIVDSEVVETRAAHLRRADDWFARAETILKIHDLFGKLTPQNTQETAREVSELCLKLGYRPRGLGKLFGVNSNSFGQFLKERYTLTSEPAGELGWDAAKLVRAVSVSEKLLDARVPTYIFRKPAQVIEAKQTAKEGGLSGKQLRKFVTSITSVTYHEAGRLVRQVNKMLSKIKA